MASSDRDRDRDCAGDRESVRGDRETVRGRFDYRATQELRFSEDRLNSPYRHISNRKVITSPLLDSFPRSTSIDSRPLDISRSNVAGSSKSIDFQEYSPSTTSKPPLADTLPYYFPILSWIGQYSILDFIGDLIGGLTLVFFQIPLALSYLTTLAHVPVLSGLLSLGLAPLIYMVFGSVPQMVVGPEAPISLVVGQALEPLLKHNGDHIDPLLYVVSITFVSGASLLGFGLGRFGFLDNVLSPSLLKGFICGVGIVMLINASVNTLGLEDLLKRIADDPDKMDILSPFDKIRFLYKYAHRYNHLSFKISLVGFVVIMTVRTLKKIAVKKPGVYKKAAYIPEILIVFIISTWLCSQKEWNLDGIRIIGKVKNDGKLILFNPFSSTTRHWIKHLYVPGFLCAMLGFFESTTASKSLGSTFDLPISSNRELVAQGCINIFCSLFGALPAFGGYGRSKINAMSAKTTMSGAIMGMLTLFTVIHLLDFFYYVPLCMLSVISAVIGVSLIEEAPHELLFHWQSKGWSELITFFVTVTTTLFFSMEAGIAVGLIYSLIRVIKNSAKSRIQILGRQPGTNTFLNADTQIHRDEKQKSFFTDDFSTRLNTDLEEIEGCLIIKIPEPLTFTNSSDLRARLRRVEIYGSTKAHPALKRTRAASMNQFILFDLNGMTELDSSAAQILMDILVGYKSRGIHVFFARTTKNKKVRSRLLHIGVVELLLESLEDINYFELESNGSNDDWLIESLDAPYFNTLQDVLRVIDQYEVDHQLKHLNQP